MELDQMTQNNAALVNQAGSATKAMNEQATALVNEVAQYRLPDSGVANTDQHSLSGTVAIDTSSFDFDTAIDAHRQWKVKLRKAISDKDTLDADLICRDNACPLGQWIHCDECSGWSSKSEFQESISGHAQFHKAAADVARKINAGQYNDAMRMIHAGTPFAQVSNEVCTLLTKAKSWMR